MDLIDKLGEGQLPTIGNKNFIKKNIDAIVLTISISMIIIGLGQAIYKSTQGTYKERYERLTGFKFDEKRIKNELNK